MPELSELARFGQSIWFDFIRRSMISSGRLQELVDKGVRGVTSNPAIFAKAIDGSEDYDQDLQKLVETGKSVEAIYENLAVKDIQMAADVLAPVYAATDGIDGYVSLEVSPLLANDTDKTIEEARRLFETVNRPNVMIKIPATPAGLPAITASIAAGVNVNVTLIFSVENYRQVHEAYIAGLEKLALTGPAAAGGHGVDRVASVASFFISRVDSALDKLLEENGHSGLRGKIGIANSKIAYEEFTKIIGGRRWRAVAERGARYQRLLWASTSTKSPDYPDTMYVDELIGPHTVNTLPPDTLETFLNHGKAALTLTENVEEARSRIERLAGLGIDLAAVTDRLQEEGVDKFAKPFEKLLDSIAAKREQLKSN